VVVGLRGVVWEGLIGRRRRWIPLNQSEKKMIVKTRRRSKVESKRRNRRSLPPARIGAAPLCLVGGAAAVEAAHHCGLGCALFGERKGLRLAKIRELEGLVES
jgi:hypothetical protein